MPEVGDCYFFDPESRDNPHFWVIVGQVKDHPQAGLTTFVMANASTKPSDTTCPLGPADHPALTTPCHIRYDQMRFVVSTASCLQSRGIGRNAIGAVTLRRIQAGAHASAWSKPVFLRHIPK